MNRPRKRPKRQRRSQSCSAVAAAATTVLISLSSTACSSSSSTNALLASPTCFVSRNNFHHHGRGKVVGQDDYDRTRGGCCSSSSFLSKPSQQQFFPQLSLVQRQRHYSQATPPRRLLSNLAMKESDDGMDNGNNNEEEEEEDEEEYYSDMKSNLNKISWLPSVKLGKQPYKPTTRSSTSRKETVDGNSYESVEGSSSSSSPPGYQNIEILPVLPMSMVHGLEGMLMDDNNNNNSDDDENQLNQNQQPPSIDELDNDNILNYINNLSNDESYGTGIWQGDPTSMISSSTTQLGPLLFSGTSSYLPHTKGHVFTVAEPRYKKLYDDLLRVGNYYGMKRDSALRRAREMEKKEVRKLGDGVKMNQDDDDDDDASLSSSPMPHGSASFPDPDEKRRFIVTAANPSQDGVFAEYGLLFQLKDLDEVAAVASYEMGGDGGMTMDELHELVESVEAAQHAEYNNDENDDSGDDIMDILLRTHYEATHDVVGRVKIHRFVNPECFSEGPDGEEYLMAEATILDVVENDRVKMLNERKSRAAAAAAESQEEEEKEQQQQRPTTSLATARAIEEAKEQAVGEVAKAVARIKDELRSSVGEAFKQQQQLDPEKIKDSLRSALDGSAMLNSMSNHNADSTTTNPPPTPTPPNNHKGGSKKGGPIPLGPKGVYVERRSDDSLTKEERALRESFARLVALQHELKEECRFTRVSVQTFGIGPVGVWLSAAAWSQFVEKRLEATHVDMQGDLQDKLVEYLGGLEDSNNNNGIGGYFGNDDDAVDGVDDGGGETIDFEDLSPELQQEFQLVQARATEELGPLALERAIQMQRIVQAESYTERLDLLRECVDNERRRLEAKKMLQSLTLRDGNDGERSGERSDFFRTREEARSLFERLMSSDVDKDDSSESTDEEAFQ
ncbi:hypothetical protein ACHAXR_013119 [Thalassiosira sp. AJA248-18]